MWGGRVQSGRNQRFGGRRMLQGLRPAGSPCSLLPSQSDGECCLGGIGNGPRASPDSSLLPTQADRTCVPTPRATPGDVESLGLFP